MIENPKRILLRIERLSHYVTSELEIQEDVQYYSRFSAKTCRTFRRLKVSHALSKP